ncbi:MAG: S-layer homology domain-containing protein, partial [Thermoleophilia bacterium]|nr:S-layer homology domain-containing protein [Thermoleophilia bacterium]
FAKMIVLTAGYPVSENDICTFGDVQNSGSGSLYPDNYVAVCAARGITTGQTPTEYAPQDYLTRAQLITMVARDAGLPEPPADYTPPFPDFSAAHYPWARKAYHSGLLDGLLEFEPDHKGVYDFWANATRGEACVLLYNLLQSG